MRPVDAPKRTTVAVDMIGALGGVTTTTGASVGLLGSNSYAVARAA